MPERLPSAALAGRRAVFLDRDGTLLHDPGYLGDPAGAVLLPHVGRSLRALASAGFALVVVTNQSGIARGKYTFERYRAVEARVAELLEAEGVRLAATYVCPYHPDGVVPEYAREHEDRKPNPGMWRRAGRDLGLDLARSYSIGDGERDAVAGKRAGTVSLLLAAERDKWPLPVGGPLDPDFTARDLAEATLWILRREGLPLERLEAPAGTGRGGAPA